MWNMDVNSAQAYVNERVAVLGEHGEVPHVHRHDTKFRSFWKSFLSLWL